ncbi:hypothetical protein [Streptomyces sp. NPDC058623]
MWPRVNGMRALEPGSVGDPVEDDTVLVCLAFRPADPPLPH